MKILAILVFILVLFFTSSTALNHRVIVFLKESGNDAGGTVEMRTTVVFRLLGGGVVAQSSARDGLPTNTGFLGLGVPIFDEVFSQDPGSIEFIIREDDGIGTFNDDGLCRFLAEPSSWPVGSNRFHCIREETNGLQAEWRLNMLVVSFPDPN